MRTTNHSVIHESWLKPSINHRLSKWEAEPTCPFGQGVSKDIIISTNPKHTERGSPSPAFVRAGGNLVGRGIANPMSERTRGFELPRNGTKFPLPALIS